MGTSQGFVTRKSGNCWKDEQRIIDCL